MRKVGSPRIVVLFAVAVFLLTFTGHCLDVTVSMVQENSMREPFDIGQTVIYNVQLDGVKNAMRYTVEMTIGPDNSDTSISKSFEIGMNANPGAPGVAQFKVNFQSPDLRRGEFGKWLIDQNRTEAWEKAWYKVRVTSLNPFEKPIEQEDYSGKPSLIKVLEEFKDEQVTPKKGTNADRFEYQVSVFSTIKDNITLEVGPSRDGPWTPVNGQEYATPGSWQILKWPNVTLGFNFISAAYKASGRKQKTFDGPFWPIDVEYKNNSVSPEWGPSDTLFNYGLEVKASKPIEVGLNVWDVSNKRYNSVGRLRYSNASQWEILTWRDIKTTSATDVGGDSKYYYGFYYEGSDEPSTTTYNEVGKYFPGPHLSVIGLQNWTVSPKNGTAFNPLHLFCSSGD